jgi:hypothetical protein
MSYFTELKLVDKITGVAAKVNADGELLVYLPPTAEVSEDNSTNTPLADDAEFTGAAVDALNYRQACIGVFADQPSAPGGLIIESSSDGTTWFTKHAYTYYNGNEEAEFFVQIARRYLRVRYVNSSTAQTEFDLSVVLR